MYNVMNDTVTIEGRPQVTYSLTSSESDMVVRDVTVDMTRAYEIADTLNRFHVAEVHVLDVLEDMLP